MNNAQGSIPRFVILAAIDESPVADAVLAQAAALARTTPGAEIHLLHVPDRFTHARVRSTSFDLDHAGQYVDARARELRASTHVHVVGHVLETEPASAIVGLGASLDADLLVVGPTRRRGPERWAFGSVAKKVVERAPCAVLVARPKESEGEVVPPIEPPCPDCLQVREASNGTERWCTRHREHHARARLHYEMPEGFGAGSSLLRGEP